MRCPEEDSIPRALPSSLQGEPFVDRKPKAFIAGTILVLAGTALILVGMDVFPGFRTVVNHKSWSAIGTALVMVGVLVALTVLRRDEPRGPGPHCRED